MRYMVIKYLISKQNVIKYQEHVFGECKLQLKLIFINILSSHFHVVNQTCA